MKKYLYLIRKAKIKSWLKFWLMTNNKFNSVLSEILEGFSFNLQNTVKRYFNIFQIFGNSTQATRSGKNLFNKNSSENISSGTTKTILDTGVRITSSMSGNFMYYATLLGKDELLNKEITISANISVSASNIGAIYLFFGNANNTTVSAIGNIVAEGVQTKTLTIPSSFPSNSDRIWIILYSNFNGTGNIGDYVDYTNLQVEIGTTPTSYEPYGASPSPNYPSPINSVADDINLCSSAVKNSDTILKFTMDKAIEKTITLSFNTNETLSSNIIYFLIDGVQNNVGTISGSESITKTITMSDEIYTAIQNSSSFELRIYKSGANFNDPENAKIQNGSIATPYSPYNQGTVTIKQRGKNLFDGVLELGIYSGSTGAKVTNNNYVRCANFQEVKELTNYKFSKEEQGIALYVYEYKSDYTYNQSAAKVVNSCEYLTTNAGTKYITFRTYLESTDTLMKIQLEERKDTNYI